MNPSKVYFTDMHTGGNSNLLKKFKELIIAAGIDKIELEDKMVAVKLNFGEPGNMAFLRHQYAKVLCDYIKEKGGKPFLTDCSTLYPGMRNNALDHLDAAYLNGYSPLSTGVQVVIADGLRGLDERLIPVEGGEFVKLAKIGSAIADADVIISLSHFKGHVSAGFGGALKNLGMGCGSKKGKMEMHSEGTPAIVEEDCIGCGMCVKYCNNNGVHIIEKEVEKDGKKVKAKKAVISEENCVGCGHCFSYCPKGAIDSKWDIAKPVFSAKIAEYTKAALNGKPAFHISLVMDISPFCDCDPSNDVPMTDDVGMFASFDPVALDQACCDEVNKMPVKIGSRPWNKMTDEEKKDVKGPRDIFKIAHPKTDYSVCLDHAAKLGLGTRSYELIKL